MTANQVKIDELRQMPAFKSLTGEQLQTITAVMVRRSYAPGQLIFLEGDPAAGLWFILAGQVKIIKQSVNGRMQGLCLIDRGKCFGSCPLFDQDSNPANAQALDEVTLAVLPRAELQRLIYNDANLAVSLMQVYNERLGLLARLGESLGSWPVPERINDCLIAHSDNTPEHPRVQLTHEEIATLVGTAREVVSRHLSRLETSGIVETHPGVVILKNINALGQSTSCIAESRV